MISYHVLEHFNNIDVCGSGNSLDCFLKKGYLFKTCQNDEFLENQAELRNLILKYGQYISEVIKQEINNYLRLNFKSKIKVVIPEKFEDLESWIEELYLEIIKAKLSIDDCIEIEKFINCKRLGEIYILLDSICEMKSIPIKKNNALEIDLIRMLKKYNLNEIYSVLDYQAKMAASRLYEIEHSKNSNIFHKDTIFAMKISSAIDFLQMRNEKPKYPKPLLENWTYSEVEVFISSTIIRNCEKWHKFIPDEILALWVESVGMQNDEENI